LPEKSDLRTKHRWHNLVSINAYWLGTSYMWNSLHIIVLPILMLSYTESGKNTAYGLLTFLGLVVAMVVQPLSGALSDRTRHRLGRRRPWILVGTLIDMVWLLTMALAKRYWLVAVSYILLQFSSNLAHGPAQGLIPDLVPRERHGIASGIKNLCDIVGIICAALVAGYLMDGATPQTIASFAIIAGVLLTVLVVTCAGAAETPTQRVEAAHWRLSLENVKEILRVDWHAQRDYAHLLLSRFFMLLGMYSLQAFGLYYFRDALRLEAPARTMGTLIATVGVSILLISLPAGALSERWGRKKLSLLAFAMTGTGMVLFALTDNLRGIWGAGGLLGLGLGIFSSVNWAWATDLVPATEAGKYLGLSNLATVGAALTSRLFGPVVDLINARFSNAGYSLVFLLTAVGAILGIIMTLRVPETRLDAHVSPVSAVPTSAADLSRE
jgi:MFS family permease